MTNMTTTLTFKPKLFSALRHYNRQQLTTDLLAGIIVGIVALPLAIAFGIASGVTPEKGIITAIVAGLIISVFGGSKVQIGGPTGAFIIIIYGIIQQYGFEGLTIATLMAGVFLIMFGVLHLGTIIKYIPYPIVVGFTSGIALTIFTTQIKDLLGLSMVIVPSDFIEKWIAYFEAFDTIERWSALVGIGSVAIIALWPKLTQRTVLGKLPGSLIAIIVMTVAALLLKQYAGVTTIETIGDRFSISATLPGAAMPDLSWDAVKGLVSPAITIAILGAIESLLSATVADGVIGDRHDSNTELIAQGMANLASPLFGGIPATGAIARTMTNINNGGRTPVAGIVHAVVLTLIFLFLMPLAQYIPMACLAGVLVVVSYNMSGWSSSTSPSPSRWVCSVPVCSSCAVWLRPPMSRSSRRRSILRRKTATSSWATSNTSRSPKVWRCMRSTALTSSAPVTVSRRSWVPCAISARNPVSVSSACVRCRLSTLPASTTSRTSVSCRRVRVSKWYSRA